MFSIIYLFYVTCHLTHSEPGLPMIQHVEKHLWIVTAHLSMFLVYPCAFTTSWQLRGKLSVCFDY